MVESNVEIRGGTLAGPIIEFGDGCDSDTLDNVFGGLAGYTLSIDGTDYHFCGTGSDADGMWAFRVRYLDADCFPEGEEFTIPFTGIEKIHIY